MCLLRKILTRLRGMNICTSSAHFALSFVRQLKGPECIQIEQHTQNTSLVPNRVNRVRSLQKIPTRLHGTNFCITSAHFARSFVRQPNSPKCTQIVRNVPKHHFTVQWGGSGAFIAKHSDSTLWHKLLHKFGPFCTEFGKATKRSQMHPNSTKRRKTLV